MSDTAVRAEVQDRILRPVADVFDAIVNPAKITQYFASHADGAMIAGQAVRWRFEDVGAELVVTGVRGTEGAETVVTATFEQKGKGAHVRLEHNGFMSEQAARQHEEAWAHCSRGAGEAPGGGGQ